MTYQKPAPSGVWLCFELPQARPTGLILLALVLYFRLSISSMLPINTGLETTKNLRSDEIKPFAEIGKGKAPLIEVQTKSPELLDLASPEVGEATRALERQWSIELGNDLHHIPTLMARIAKGKQISPYEIWLKDLLIDRLKEAHDTLYQKEFNLRDLKSQLVLYKWVQKTWKEKFSRYLKLQPDVAENLNKKISGQPSEFGNEDLEKLLESFKTQDNFGEEAFLQELKDSAGLSLEQKMLKLELYEYNEEGINLLKDSQKLKESLEGKEPIKVSELSDSFSGNAMDHLFRRAVKSLENAFQGAWSAAPQMDLSMENQLHNAVGALFDRLFEGKTWTLEEKKLLKELNQEGIPNLSREQWSLIDSLSTEQAKKQNELLKKKATVYESSFLSSSSSRYSHSSDIDGISGEKKNESGENQKEKNEVLEEETYFLNLLENNRFDNRKLRDELNELRMFVSGRKIGLAQFMKEIEKGRISNLKYDSRFLIIRENLMKEELSFFFERIEEIKSQQETQNEKIRKILSDPQNQSNQINPAYQKSRKGFSKFFNFFQGKKYSVASGVEHQVEENIGEIEKSRLFEKLVKKGVIYLDYHKDIFQRQKIGMKMYSRIMEVLGELELYKTVKRDDIIKLLIRGHQRLEIDKRYNADQIEILLRYLPKLSIQKQIDINQVGRLIEKEKLSIENLIKSIKNNLEIIPEFEINLEKDMNQLKSTIEYALVKWKENEFDLFYL